MDYYWFLFHSHFSDLDSFDTVYYYVCKFLGACEPLSFSVSQIALCQILNKWINKQLGDATISACPSSGTMQLDDSITFNLKRENPWFSRDIFEIN